MAGIAPWPSLDLWARLELQEKGIDPDEGALATATAELSRALRRTYGAVAFDIDGTLTSADELDVNVRLAETIRSLLRKSVHVILITGRGRSASDVVMQIAVQDAFSRRYLARLTCVVDNGATLLQVSIAEDDIEIESVPLEQFDLGVEWAIAVMSVVPQIRGDPEIRIRARAERIRLEMADIAVRDSVFVNLQASQTVLSDKLGRPCFLARGQFQGLFTIDITPTTKGRALSILCNRLGIHPDRVLRIGDQGQFGGNDFEILDNASGFSVGDCSNAPGRCHPVFDTETESIAKHAYATDQLLSWVRLQPPLTLAPSADDAVITELVDVERVAWRSAASAQKEARQLLGVRIAQYFHDDNSDILELGSTYAADIYDPLSGAVRLRHWEVLEAESSDSLFSSLFGLNRFDFSAVAPATDWAMYSDSAVLLRGPGYYSADVPGGVPERDRLLNYFHSALQFITQATAAISQLPDVPTTLTRVKLLLGVADNVRNFLLQIGHLAYVVETEEGAGVENVFLPVLEELLPEHTARMVEMHEPNDAGWHDSLFGYFQLLIRVGEVLSSIRDTLLAVGIRDAAEELKTLRRRECDSFLENLTAVRVGLSKHVEQERLTAADELIVLGLCHGGIEFPFIARSVGLRMNRRVHAGLLSVSNYSKPDTAAEPGMSRYDPADVLQNIWLEGPARFSNFPVILADDNITTGRTLEQARDAMIDTGRDVLGAIVVRYPSVGRLPQMRFTDSAIPDPKVLLTFTRGLIAAAPYARLIESQDQTGGGRYLDASGVFDKSRDRVRRYLLKNNRPEGGSDE